MRIWSLMYNANNYENLERVGEFSLELLQSFDGRSKVEDWTPLAFKAMYGNRPWGDASSYHTHMPIVTRRVIEATRDLLGNNVEILPVLCEKQELFLLNVTQVLDCIDYTRAIYKRFPSSGRIMRFKKFSFIKDKVIGMHVFKIKEQPLYGVFVSDEFRQRILDNGLEGFAFELVWDSEVE